jgi:hypothetical protein
LKWILKFRLRSHLTDQGHVLHHSALLSSPTVFVYPTQGQSDRQLSNCFSIEFRRVGHFDAFIPCCEYVTVVDQDTLLDDILQSGVYSLIRLGVDRRVASDEDSGGLVQVIFLPWITRKNQVD